MTKAVERGCWVLTVTAHGAETPIPGTTGDTEATVRTYLRAISGPDGEKSVEHLLWPRGPYRIRTATITIVPE